MSRFLLLDLTLLQVFLAVHDSQRTSERALVEPVLGIGQRIAEHFEEEGLGEGVEFGESLAALGPQCLRQIQNRRNPPLLLGAGIRDL